MRSHPSAGRTSIVLAGILASTLTLAAETAPYAVSASATLRRDEVPLHSDRFTLRATLAAPDAAIARSPALSEGGHFVLAAKMVAEVMACYNDTIFRDDFDGDGF